MKNNKTTYEVYTYFGRVVERISASDDGLYLHALAEAQRSSNS
jgi:hypothetical protein